MEAEVHGLCGAIEKRLTFISLEALAVEQLAAIREQREHFRMIGLELVAELGRPLKEELPSAISSSISSAMAPLLAQVGQIGAEGMGAMVQDLSSRFSDDVGRALAQASESLAQAGDRFAQLSDRMDQSSGRVGTEIDGAVTRLTQAVEDLRDGMGATAQTASGAFTKGAEQMLAVMNQTLENIRDNTGERSPCSQRGRGRDAPGGQRLSKRDQGGHRSGDDGRPRTSGSRQQKRGGGNRFGRTDSARCRELVPQGDLGPYRTVRREGRSRILLTPLDLISDRMGEGVANLSEGATGMRRLSGRCPNRRGG